MNQLPPASGKYEGSFFFQLPRGLPSPYGRPFLGLPWPLPLQLAIAFPLPRRPPPLSKSLGAYSPSAPFSFPLLDWVPQKGSVPYSEVVQYRDNPWLGRGKPLIPQPSSKNQFNI